MHNLTNDQFERLAESDQPVPTSKPDLAPKTLKEDSESDDMDMDLADDDDEDEDERLKMLENIDYENVKGDPDAEALADIQVDPLISRKENEVTVYKLKPLRFNLKFTYSILFRYFSSRTGYLKLPFGRTCPDKVWMHKVLAAFDPQNGLGLVMTADEYSSRVLGLKGLYVANGVHPSDADRMQRFSNSSTYNIRGLIHKTSRDMTSISMQRDDILSINYEIHLERQRLKEIAGLATNSYMELSKIFKKDITSTDSYESIRRVNRLSEASADDKELERFVFDQFRSRYDFTIDVNAYLFLL